MNPSEYQRLAARTECDQLSSLTRMSSSYDCREEGDVLDLTPIRLNHAALGITNEAGELAKVVIKWIYYGQPLDKGNAAEELGDILWHVAQACNALGLDIGKLMEANLAKLKARYPDEFTEERAAEEGRDRGLERTIVSGGIEDQ